MSWRLEVHHRTTYSYSGNVEESHNEARLTPQSDARQTVLSSSLEVSPRTTPHCYTDAFGSVVHAFDLHTPHDRLTVIGHSVTETAPPVPSLDRLGWNELRGTKVAEHFYDYLAPTRLVDSSEPMRAAADELGAFDDPMETAAAVFDYVRSRLTYLTGSTVVETTATDAFDAGAGVCQDFVHVSLALLRRVGLPARYVSGYVHNRPDAMLGEPVRGESHAWVDVWTGGWWGFDPTGDVTVGETSRRDRPWT